MLSQRTKRELIDALVELAGDDRGILRRLDALSSWEPRSRNWWRRHAKRSPMRPTSTSGRSTTISTTTTQPTEEVKRNLGRLIDLGQLRLAMELSRELMDQGSHQVEMSDEGLMTSDIEECLQVVVQALPKSNMPPGEIVAWCKAMIA